jgi:hypothetical protein
VVAALWTVFVRPSTPAMDAVMGADTMPCTAVMTPLSRSTIPTGALAAPYSASPPAGR